MVQHEHVGEAHQSSSSRSSYRKGMAWKMWNAIMPRLLGKRANTKACRPLLPLQYTHKPLRHSGLSALPYSKKPINMPCVTNMLF